MKTYRFISSWKKYHLHNYKVLHDYLADKSTFAIQTVNSKLFEENYLHLLLESYIMKVTWIWLLFLVGQSTLSDCRPQNNPGNRIPGGPTLDRRGCLGKLSLYQGASSWGYQKQLLKQ